MTPARDSVNSTASVQLARKLSVNASALPLARETTIPAMSINPVSYTHLNVSLDIKTPLTSIINYVDFLKKEDIDNEKAQEYIGVLDRQANRLKKLTAVSYTHLDVYKRQTRYTADGITPGSTSSDS